MKYPTESALQNHYLDTVLPHCHKPDQHFSKNKDFYKPEQFIWNNPHRTSEQMYKFYHLYNDKYKQHKQVQIHKLQQHDRIVEENNRILKLSQMRNNTRQNFVIKQQKRQLLQARCRHNSLRNCTKSELTYGASQKSITSMNTFRKQQFLTSNDIKPRNQSQVIQSSQLLKHNRKYNQSELVRKIEDSYQQGLFKFDRNRRAVVDLIEKQQAEYRENTRVEFALRKEKNFSTIKQQTKMDRIESYSSQLA